VARRGLKRGRAVRRLMVPRVFTGRAIIPGDRIREGLQALEAAERARRPFREYLEGLSREFAGYLAGKFSAQTARKQASIVSLFVDFLVEYTDVKSLDDVTPYIATAQFEHWYRRKVWDLAHPRELTVALRKFFRFLSQEKGITNEKVLNGLR
jgi:site-specific recombinase XerD